MSGNPICLVHVFITAAMGLPLAFSRLSQRSSVGEKDLTQDCQSLDVSGFIKDRVGEVGFLLHFLMLLCFY